MWYPEWIEVFQLLNETWKVRSLYLKGRSYSIWLPVCLGSWELDFDLEPIHSFSSTPLLSLYFAQCFLSPYVYRTAKIVDLSNCKSNQKPLMSNITKQLKWKLKTDLTHLILHLIHTRFGVVRIIRLVFQWIRHFNFFRNLLSSC